MKAKTKRTLKKWGARLRAYGEGLSQNDSWFDTDYSGGTSSHKKKSSSDGYAWSTGGL